ENAQPTSGLPSRHGRHTTYQSPLSSWPAVSEMPIWRAIYRGHPFVNYDCGMRPERDYSKNDEPSYSIAVAGYWRAFVTSKWIARSPRLRADPDSRLASERPDQKGLGACGAVHRAGAAERESEHAGPRVRLQF